MAQCKHGRSYWKIDRDEDAIYCKCGHRVATFTVRESRAAYGGKSFKGPDPKVKGKK